MAQLQDAKRKMTSMATADWHAGAEGFHMPQGDDEQRTSKGYAFVEFNTPEVSTLSSIMAHAFLAHIACPARTLKRCKQMHRYKIEDFLYMLPEKWAVQPKLESLV